MAYEELREKGNKYFNKGKYYLALDYYERAMSLFRWLEHREVPQTPNISQTLIESEQSLEEQSENSQSGSKIQIELDKETEAEDPFNELKTKYKEFFITYHDDNVK
jgi:tetratricopeptide (TPR) repeat protein